MTTLRPIGESARRVTLLERIVSTARSDRTVAQIMAATGASESRVRFVLDECELPYCRERDPEATWTAEMESALARMWADGLSLTTIGKRLQVSRNSIAGKARRMGLPKRAVHPNFARGV